MIAEIFDDENDENQTQDPSPLGQIFNNDAARGRGCKFKEVLGSRVSCSKGSLARLHRSLPWDRSMLHGVCQSR